MCGRFGVQKKKKNKSPTQKIQNSTQPCSHKTPHLPKQNHLSINLNNLFKQMTVKNEHGCTRAAWGVQVELPFAPASHQAPDLGDRRDRKQRSREELR